MDNDQITALAREYAEEIIKGKPSEELPNCLKNSMLTMNTEYVAEIFQWLTRRFFLVEKSAVEFEYNEVKEYLEKDRYLDMYDEYEAKRGLLEYLFPEIGKEVEG